MPASHDTQVLLQRIRSGESSACNELYEKYALRILSIVRSRLGPQLRQKVESWDIVQEAMLDSLRQIETFEYRNEGAFLNWWSKIVENRIRQQYKHFHAQRRDMDRENSPSPRSVGGETTLNMEGGMDAAPTPSQLLQLNDELQQLEEALDLLDEPTRELLIASEIEGKSHVELAAELDKTPDAVRMQIKRAKVNLARAFQSLEGPEPGVE